MPHKVKDATAGDLVITALDFDGCIQRTEKEEINTREEYLASKHVLLAFLKSNKTGVILSGSSRTHPEIDKDNSTVSARQKFRYKRVDPGSSFNIFTWLEINRRIFDPFFLNDLWAKDKKGQDYEVGDTFRLVKALFEEESWENEILLYHERYMKGVQAVKSDLLDTPEYHSAIYNMDKINIVYAHLHYLANTYPNKTITYQLVDDNEEFLFSLSYFYNTHPELVPSNIQIQFICNDVDRRERTFLYVHSQTTPYNTGCYDGDDIPEDDVPTLRNQYKFYPYTQLSEEQKALCTIQGKGAVDKQYRETVKYLSAPKFYKPLKRPISGKPYRTQPKLGQRYFSTTIDVARFIAARDALAIDKVAEECVRKSIKAAKALFFKSDPLSEKAVEAQAFEKTPATGVTAGGC